MHITFLPDCSRSRHRCFTLESPCCGNASSLETQPLKCRATLSPWDLANVKYMYSIPFGKVHGCLQLSTVDRCSSCTHVHLYRTNVSSSHIFTMAIIRSRNLAYRVVYFSVRLFSVAWCSSWHVIHFLFQMRVVCRSEETKLGAQDSEVIRSKGACTDVHSVQFSMLLSYFVIHRWIYFACMVYTDVDLVRTKRPSI
jgi:hypothetical protein